MDELRLTYDEESGCWTEYKEPFATVECQTEEDYNYLVAALEFYKDRDKYVNVDTLKKMLCERCNEELSESPCEPSECFILDTLRNAKMDGETQSPPGSSSNSSSPDM